MRKTGRRGRKGTRRIRLRDEKEPAWRSERGCGIEALEEDVGRGGGVLIGKGSRSRLPRDSHRRDS
eukprot:1388499-Pyramimonas_sp.AAC.1